MRASLRARTYPEADHPASLDPWAALGTFGARSAAMLLVIFLVLPIAALLWRSTTGEGFIHSVTQPLVIHALLLTVITSLLTVGLSLLLGTPLAFLLARTNFAGKSLVEAATTLPIVLPPLVAGVALLVAFGRRGVLGDQLEAIGVELPFTTAAVVLAQFFVSAPFYVRAARLGFAAIPRELEDAARVDGASGWRTFQQITIPLALPSIVSGLVLCAARAFSEFGATLMFAGNLEGRTQTMSLAIESAMNTDLGAALALSVVLIVIAAAAMAIPLIWLHGSEAL